ncbi:hypothetical protein DFR67_101229 [Williamsia limnetica]|uniref:Uncharacterized protein n=1 Tax=Williamsia limnetica TaxID=882452 RepID=A0A318RPN1_WILLI|nr:hypothetical protein DFR67_101229 [Williamsia limnetica]
MGSGALKMLAVATIEAAIHVEIAENPTRNSATVAAEGPPQSPALVHSDRPDSASRSATVDTVPVRKWRP